VVMATFTPAKAFGASAYGPLKYRVSIKGVAGDWQPWPISCACPCSRNLIAGDPRIGVQAHGSSLYLIDSVSADAEFAKPVTVPDGFLGSTLPVPTALGTLYLKLRDNPQIVNPAALSVQALPPPRRDGPHRGAPVGARSDPAPERT